MKTPAASSRAATAPAGSPSAPACARVGTPSIGTAGSRCVIHVRPSLEHGPDIELPLTFTGDLLTTRLTATPNHHLTDRQDIAVHGTGLTQGPHGVELMQCTTQPPGRPLTDRCAIHRYAPSDGPTFDHTFRVRRHLRRSSGHVVDCATTPCRLVWEEAFRTRVHSTGRLWFDP